MRRILIRSMIAVVCSLVVGARARSDDAAVSQVIDKAVKALGGQEALEKAKVLEWKSKGKITIEGNENAFQSEAIVQGIERYQSSFEGEFNGNAIKAVSIVDGAKGWRKFGGQVLEMDEDSLKNEKRSIYLMLVPTTILPLKSKDFKVESAPDEKVNDRPAATLKVTGPDGKGFTLSFDKETGLPVRTVAKVTGWMGEEYVQEQLYADYKDFSGLKKATKLTIKRDGETFLTQEISDVKVLDKAPSDAFVSPK